jgi:hypothetical protein
MDSVLYEERKKADVTGPATLFRIRERLRKMDVLKRRLERAEDAGDRRQVERLKASLATLRRENARDQSSLARMT